MPHDYPATPRGLRAKGSAAVRRDMRRSESKLFEATRLRLVADCVDPSFAQLAAIDGICRLTVCIAGLDEAVPDHDRRLIALNKALQASYKVLQATPAPRRGRKSLVETIRAEAAR